MKKIKLHCFFLAFMLIGTFAAQAQVTVGSAIQPVKGSLLDLKEYAEADNTSSDKGLGLPRVKLVALDQLFPMFDKVVGTDYMYDNDATTKYPKSVQDLSHVGLAVYNLTVDASEKLEKGVYFWDGAKWEIAGSGSGSGSNTGDFFYMPSIDISFTKVEANLEINLYDAYVKQFTKDATNNPTFVSSDATLTTIPSPTAGTLFTASELTYVVTYYDTDVMNIQSIDANGKMIYDIKKVKTTADSYINIIFVVK